MHSIAAAQADNIVLLAQRKKDGGWATLKFVVDLAVPHPLLNLEVRPANAPARGTNER